MKLRKTRIKKITKPNGGEIFIPQINTFFGLDWTAFTDYTSHSLPTSLNWLIIDKHELSYKQFCKSFEEAQDVIDTYIAYVNHQNASEIENKITKTEYIDYP